MARSWWPASSCASPRFCSEQADRALVAVLARDRRRLLVAADRGLEVALVHREDAEVAARARLAVALPGGARELQALLEVPARGGEVALLGGEHARPVGGPHPQRRRAAVEGQRVVDERRGPR